MAAAIEQSQAADRERKKAAEAAEAALGVTGALVTAKNFADSQLLFGDGGGGCCPPLRRFVDALDAAAAAEAAAAAAAERLPDGSGPLPCAHFSTVLGWNKDGGRATLGVDLKYAVHGGKVYAKVVKVHEGQAKLLPRDGHPCAGLALHHPPGDASLPAVGDFVVVVESRRLTSLKRVQDASSLWAWSDKGMMLRVVRPLPVGGGGGADGPGAAASTWFGGCGDVAALRQAVVELLRVEVKAVKWFKGYARQYLQRLGTRLAGLDASPDLPGTVQGEATKLDNGLIAMPSVPGGVPDLLLADYDPGFEAFNDGGTLEDDGVELVAVVPPKVVPIDASSVDSSSDEEEGGGAGGGAAAAAPPKNKVVVRKKAAKAVTPATAAPPPDATPKRSRRTAPSSKPKNKRRRT